MRFPSLASPVLFMSSHIMNERLKEIKGRIKREEEEEGEGEGEGEGGDYLAPRLLIYYKVTFLW